MTDGIRRRKGDRIAIPGDYQHRALTEGSRVQRAWHREKLALIEWFFEARPGERVLDVGCGSGVFAALLAGRGCEVVGVDANPQAVDFARRAYAVDGLRFEQGLLDELAFPPASFDAATCLEVVEHVEPHQVTELLRALRRLLRPGGRLLLTTPNYRGLWPAVEWCADRFGGTARMDADQHVNRYHRALLRAALEDEGFRVARLRTYCTFAPFAAALSTGVADAVARLERRVDLPFGNLLAASAEAR